jgi:GDP-L-fucose synthase
MIDKKIFLAGHNGLVGSSIFKKIKSSFNVITRDKSYLDLRNKDLVDQFFFSEKPSTVILAAAKVGGIKANYENPVDFLLQNLEIQNNIISLAYKHNVKNFIFLGSSCIYPKLSSVPISEDQLLTGPLEETNRAYALAKIAGIELISSYNKQHKKAWISLMPCNLYGENDNFDPKTSHVLPALIRKIYFAKVNNEKKVKIWGSGNPKREFLHSDDLANAVDFILNLNDNDLTQAARTNNALINIGTGCDIKINDLAKLIGEIMDYEFEIVNDPSEPDGTLVKTLDTKKINNLGWTPKISLRQGITSVVEYFKENHSIL